eukprot:Gb_09335 [translate_table: standard]
MGILNTSVENSACVLDQRNLRLRQLVEALRFQLNVLVYNTCRSTKLSIEAVGKGIEVPPGACKRREGVDESVDMGPIDIVSKAIVEILEDRIGSALVLVVGIEFSCCRHFKI